MFLAAFAVNAQSRMSTGQNPTGQTGGRMSGGDIAKDSDKSSDKKTYKPGSAWKLSHSRGINNRYSPL